MTKLEKWCLRVIFRRQVTQGFDHGRRITDLYAMIRQAAHEEFTDDNPATLNQYLTELFQRSLK